MADDKELKFKITGDSTGGRKALGETARAADRTEKELRDVGRAGDEAADGIDAIGDSATDSADRVSELTGALGGLLTLEAIRRFTTDAVDQARRSEAAIRGLDGVASQAGVGIGEAFATAQRLAADGLLTVGDAAKSLQNLLGRGYDIAQAEQTLTRLKDAAAFNRAAHLSLGEAVVTATEGLKNENSTLVDNAGVTKNVSVLWKEYAAQIGTTVGKLTQQQKIQAEVNGILRETEAQAGNAAKALQGMEGQVAQMNQAISELETALGGALFPVITKVAEAGAKLTSDFIKPFFGGVELLGARVAKLIDDLTDVYDTVIGDDSIAELPARLADNARVLDDVAADIIDRYENGLTPAMQAAASAAGSVGESSAAALEQAGELADGVEASAAGAADALTGLDEALKALGTSRDAVVSGMSDRDRAIVDSFATVVDSGQYAGEELARVFNAALGRISDEGVADLSGEMRRALGAGLISEAELDQAFGRVIQTFGRTAEAAEESGRRIDEAFSGGGDALDERLQELRNYLEGLRTGALDYRTAPNPYGFPTVGDQTPTVRGEVTTAPVKVKAPLRVDATQAREEVERAFAAGPLQAPVQFDATQARAEVEQEFATNPLQVPVRFVAAGSDLEDLALARGD